MQSQRFRPLVDTTGPFVSVFFDDTHDTQDAAAQLDARLRDVRKHLEEQSISAAVIEAIDTAVRAAHPPVGRSGRGVIAAGERIVFDEHLIHPPVSTVVRVSELPYLVPVVEHGVSHASYLTVAVDHTGADIALHRDGRAGAETVTGSGHPVHAAHRAETSGYGGPQGRVEEAVRKNVREVAHRVTELVDKTAPDIVFVTGESGARAELVSELPERVTAMTVQLHGGGRAGGIDEDEVRHEMSAEFVRRRQAAVEDAAERFAAGRGTGLAVEGLAEVTAALRDGAVATLIIGDLGEATLVAGADLATLAPTAEALSALGGAPARVVRADEALPLLAVATGAALVSGGERLQPADGVGAVLRYPDAGAH